MLTKKSRGHEKHSETQLKYNKISENTVQRMSVTVWVLKFSVRFKLFWRNPITLTNSLRAFAKW